MQTELNSYGERGHVPTGACTRTRGSAAAFKFMSSCVMLNVLLMARLRRWCAPESGSNDVHKCSADRLGEDMPPSSALKTVWMSMATP